MLNMYQITVSHVQGCELCAEPSALLSENCGLKTEPEMTAQISGISNKTIITRKFHFVVDQKVLDKADISIEWGVSSRKSIATMPFNSLQSTWANENWSLFWKQNHAKKESSQGKAKTAKVIQVHRFYGPAYVWEATDFAKSIIQPRFEQRIWNQ